MSFMYVRKCRLHYKQGILKRLLYTYFCYPAEEDLDSFLFFAIEHIEKTACDVFLTRAQILIIIKKSMINLTFNK